MRQSTTWMLAAAAAIVCFSLPTRGFAATHYLDPQDGSIAGDGTKADPWGSLKEVVEAKMFATRDWKERPYNENRELETIRDKAPIQPGDTLVLMSGNHGNVTIAGAYNEKPITIKAGNGESPKLSRLLLRAAANWTIKGVTISPSFADTYEPLTMIEIDNHDFRGPSRDITVKNCTVYSVDDASSWSAKDWNDKAANGISADGDGVRIENNTVRNVDFGISTSGADSFVGGNTVDGFAGDGLRGLGNNSKFVYNTIKNAWDVNDNHDDGFQSYSTGQDGIGSGEIKGGVLRGNLIINHENPSAEMRSSLQGIGLFDGMYVDWTIENNVVITDHWHGITMLGARDSQIVNNTLIDIDDTDPGPPWIKVGAHKDGTKSQNVVVRNNLTRKLDLADNGVTADHNITYSDPSKHFVDPGTFDLHLKKSSPAVDAGSSMLAPKLDRDRVPRPQGDSVDIGAYEWHEGDVTGPDTGDDAGGDAATDTGGGDAGGDAGAPDTGPSPDADGDTGGIHSDIGDDVVYPDADAGGDTGSSSPPSDEDASGCGCSTSPADGGGLPSLLIFGLVAVGMRRRRHRR